MALQVNVRKNQNGGLFVQGFAKPDTWLRIQKELHLGFSIRKIAAKIGSSPGLVSKVKLRMKKGEWKPRKGGMQKGWSKLLVEDKYVLQAILESYQCDQISELQQLYLELMFRKIPIGRAALYSYLPNL